MARIRLVQVFLRSFVVAVERFREKNIRKTAAKERDRPAIENVLV